MIPCYIIVYNQKKWLEKLIADVKRLGAKPIICDMNSTWHELLDWYKTLDIDVQYLKSAERIIAINWILGHEEQFIITDPDLDLSTVPDDCLEMLSKGFEFRQDIWKVGLSLSIDDLPETELKKEIVEWEGKYWKERVWQYKGIDYYLADIDTTFALYRKERFKGNFYGPALRIGKPYTARHIPWYYTREELLNDPELKKYFETANLRTVHWTNKVVQGRS